MRIQSFDIRIGDLTLRQLRSLRTIQLPEGLEVIGEGWFADSASERVLVPASVKKIEKCAFACCERLRHIDFANGNQLEEIGEHCFYDSALESVQIPSRVKVIRENAFNNCQFLKKITFQKNSVLEKIESLAFFNSAIEAFVAPDSLRTIGDKVF